MSDLHSAGSDSLDGASKTRWIGQEYEGEGHVYPERGDRPHVLSPDCWCSPVIAEDLLVVHRGEIHARQGGFA